MLSPVRFFPKNWRTDVVVLRGGGRDPKGNPLPTVEIPVEGCLIGPRSTSEPLDRSDTAESNVALYHDAFLFLSKDRIRVPEGNRMAGEWSVAGRPGEWPLGVEVPLVRA
jgi:hypothetical protein